MYTIHRIHNTGLIKEILFPNYIVQIGESEYATCTIGYFLVPYATVESEAS